MKFIFGGVFFLMAACLFAGGKCDVAAFVWPAYQPEPRWSELGIFGHGNGEWQNVYEATPKKEGHLQPRIPLWGYENEASPAAVARKIDAALAAGINVFIYDWYWYEGRPFLENALNEGFLKAPNSGRMNFYIMWANHHVDYLWNNTKSEKRVKPPLFNAAVGMEEFKKVADRIVSKYFSRPNYYKIDGKPVFGIYLLSVLEEGLGGPEKIKEAFEYVDSAAKKAGFAGVHIQVIGGVRLKAKNIGGIESPSLGQIFKYLGVDSSTSYNWLQLAPRAENGADWEYDEWGKEACAKFDAVKKNTATEYFPQVTVGWDNNPRYPAQTYTAVCKNNTPELVEKYLRTARDWILKNSDGKTRLITINSWNEWTEGSYLEPDNINGYGFLNACAKVFVEECSGQK